MVAIIGSRRAYIRPKIELTPTTHRMSEGVLSQSSSPGDRETIDSFELDLSSLPAFSPLNKLMLNHRIRNIRSSYVTSRWKRLSIRQEHRAVPPRQATSYLTFDGGHSAGSLSTSTSAGLRAGEFPGA